MQIGEFAKICGTKITVLRHYDKEGLLEPDYVDAFTGYRYYSDEQIPIFFRITALRTPRRMFAEKITWIYRSYRILPSLDHGAFSIV
jgi:DNA-binding transcriptional MerR regulator